MQIRKIVRLIVPTVAGLVSLGLTTDADAAAVAKNLCAVTGVFFDDSTGARLAVAAACLDNSGVPVPATQYYAFASAPAGCPSTSAATVRVWESMAHAAFLSGKRLNIFHEDNTSCSNAIYSMRIVN